MKKILLALLAISVSLSVFACSPREDAPQNTPDDPPSNQPQLPTDYIYTENTEVHVVYNGDALSHEGVSKIYSALRDAVWAPPVFATDTSPVAEHEIVIGKTARPISEKAYRLLELMEREEESHLGYVIYSDGNSVAIAYDKDEFDFKLCELEAMNYFIENHLTESSLVLKEGIVMCDSFDVVKRQQAIDEAEVAAKWDEARATLARTVGDELAADVIRAMQNCYTLFTDDVIDWFANLYDPVTGGYYYSNSGRNTVGYGPDLESTYQALSFMGGTGLADGINTREGEDVIPEWMQQQILKFAMELQDPVSGYFYHPQWGGDSFDDRRDLIDKGYTSRRGRDLQWALSLIQRFGGQPTYDIPTMGIKGSGLLYDGTPVSKSELTASLKLSASVMVSKVMAASSAVPTHLQSADNLRSYLNGLDVNGDSYTVGNLLESQSKQIVARDKVLDPTGKTTPLANVVKEFFDSHQNKENGAWTLGEKIDYESVNGILKISGVYNGIQKEFPNPVKAIKTAMAGITMEEPPTTVCYVLNPWYAITMLIQNVESYNSSPDKAEVQAAIADIRMEILENAVELINVTREKSAEFKKSDGSFSYFPKSSGPNSQGVPVAIPETNEGDVNATHMFISGIPNHIWGILGCEVVPIFTKSDRMRYWNILEGLGEIVKNEVEELAPEDYELEDIGTLPAGVSVQTGLGSSVGIVSTMGKNGRPTKALALTTIPGSTDIMRLTLDEFMPFFNAVVFEADIKIESKAGGGQFEMLPYGSPGDAYRIIIDYSKGGAVTARTANDFKSTNIGKEGEWIHLKLEYSFADIDYDRNGTKDLQVKLYADNKLVAEGRIPPGSEAINHGSVSGVRFFSWTASDATLFVDNLLFRQDKVTLDPPPVVNEEDESERITFESSTNENIPGKVGIGDVSDKGTVTVENVGSAEAPNKALLLASPSGSTDSLKFYLTKKADLFNAVALDMDIKLSAVNAAGDIDLYFTTAYNATAARLILSYGADGITVKKVNAQGEVEFTKTIGALGEWLKLHVEYSMDKEGVRMKLSVGGELIAEGTAAYNSFHGAENLSYVKLTVKDNADVTLALDNISLAQTLMLRDGEEEADGDGEDFEDTSLEDIEDSLGLILSDKATAEIVEDVRGGRLTKVLRLVSPQKSLDSFLFKFGEENLDTTNTVAFEGDFKITNADAGNILTLYHKTADGKIANKIVFGWSSSSGNIFVLNLYNNGSSKDFDVVVVPEGMNGYFKLRVEYTKLSDTEIKIGFIVNGERIAAIDVAHPYENPAIDADLVTEVVLETYESRKSTVFVDNLVIERTNLDVGGSEEPEEPDTPVIPDPPTPPAPPEKPKEEYGGSIYDDDEDGSTSSGNWT